MSAVTDGVVAETHTGATMHGRWCYVNADRSAPCRILRLGAEIDGLIAPTQQSPDPHLDRGRRGECR